MKYQWYVNYGCDQFIPHEKLFSTVEEAKKDIADYVTGTKIPITACGIDIVENVDGCISVIQHLIIPQETYWEDD